MKAINVHELREKVTLTENESFKAIYFVFEEESAIPQHTYKGLATVQVICGEVQVHFVNGQSVTLKEGDFLPFDARIEHYVIAKEKTKALLTIQQS
ncbi:MAG: cupin domain-containing protein [Niameybacter sp.]|uniref:cupin domain-containing protein n=1 Tax=Niameybacter sp. TaxID=2033640 RepID=UPI002FCC0847